MFILKQFWHEYCFYNKKEQYFIKEYMKGENNVNKYKKNLR